MSKTYMTGEYYKKELQRIIKENEDKYPKLKDKFFHSNIFNVLALLSAYKANYTPQCLFDSIISAFEERGISL